MASKAVLEEIKKELHIVTEEPFGKALWEKKIKEGPGSTPRTKFLYKRCRWKTTAAGVYVREEVKVGLERARLWTEAHKTNVGEIPIVHRARCLEHYLKNCSLFICDDELIVGDHCEYPNTVEIYPECGSKLTVDFMEDPALTLEELYDEGMKIAEYWKPFSLQEKCERYFEPAEIAIASTYAICDPPPWIHFYTNCVPPFQSVLEDGLEKRIKWCEDNIKEAHAKLKQYPWRGEENIPLLKKIDTWTAMIIAGRAVIGWARRYSRLAKYIAENFDLSDSTVGVERRKKELLEIADICYHVPAEPCKGFKDAMQSKWLLYEITQTIERYASGYSHLEDRLMWPYYKASVIDKTAQPMTRDEAIELIECERLKICERGVGHGRVTRTGLPGINDLHILTIGGLDVNGNDACNDLTDVILEAALNIHTNEPSIGFRYSPKLNEKTRRLVYECIAQGYGFPSLKHEEKNIKQTKEFFEWPDEEIGNWCLVLCMAPGVNRRRSTQKSRNEGGAGVIICAHMVTLALMDGFDHFFTRSYIGARTGDATKFKTFEELFDVVRKQCQHASQLFWRMKDVTRYVEQNWLESPFLALMDDYCVEAGVGAHDASKPWANNWADPVFGGGPIADDLAAIKYWIFDKKKYTMEQLINALKANWVDYEEMRRDFIAAPKWGNDDNYVDEIGTSAYHMIADCCNEQSLQGWKKGCCPVPQSVSLFSMLAPLVGAQAFGRKWGEVIHDGGCSPYMGMDKKGPTAVLKTMSKIPQMRYKGIQLNQRFPVGLMRESEKGFDIWTSYMKTWHDFNIDHVQFNVVRSEDMRAAQREPEKWEHLIVRIAGYSAKFIALPKLTQDAIIARTEQEIGL